MRKAIRPISTTNSIQDSMLDHENMRCRTWDEVSDGCHAICMWGGKVALTKIAANSRLDCQAWNLQSILSVYACRRRRETAVDMQRLSFREYARKDAVGCESSSVDMY